MKKVIVVDDNPAIGTMISRMLEGSEFSCILLTSAEDLLTRLGEEPIDLLITDIFMPRVEGIEVILAVQASFADLPIVAMSGGGQSIGLDVLRNAKQLGAKQVLAKPFRRGELIAAIEAALGTNA
jgi:CheY-like chemotaxis protein